jgi:hypothetical protein
MPTDPQWPGAAYSTAGAPGVVGRKVGRTIYDATEPSDENPEGGRLIGVMDTPELAAFVVAAVNAMEALRTTDPAIMAALSE